jgi:hypothetical protein
MAKQGKKIKKRIRKWTYPPVQVTEKTYKYLCERKVRTGIPYRRSLEDSMELLNKQDDAIADLLGIDSENHQKGKVA